MDVDRAIAIIETVLAPKSLNPVQVQIIRGVLAGNSYQEIAVAAKADCPPEQLLVSTAGDVRQSKEVVRAKRPAGGYQIGYIRETAAQLWQCLSQRLEQKVTKNSLAAVLLWYTKQPIYQLTQGRNLTSESIDSSRKFQRLPLPGKGSTNDRQEGTQQPAANLELNERFYGRTEELTTLTDWCLYERCRTIFLIGMGGMGKTTLAWEIARQLEGYFDRTIWRSLLNLPPVLELCADLLRFLSPQPLDLPDSLEGQIELLIACLRRDRCLLIFDNVESILEGQVQSGQYLPGYDGYDRLFRALGELPHQSCAILTSREKPHTIARSQIVNPQLVRSMTIDGMTSAATHQLVQAYGCPQLPDAMWQEIHAHYGGNPLALKIAAITALELIEGGDTILDLYPLMKSGKFQFRNIDDILCRQFDRLSPLEQQLVYWLAIEREPMTGAELRSNLVLNNDLSGEIINAIQSLSRRCIITSEDRTWSIQPVTIAYVTIRLIDQFVAELSPSSPTDPPPTDLIERFCHLNTYAMIKAQTKDYLRQIQIQSILRPILDRLVEIWGDHVQLSQHLRQILTTWQTLDPIPAGYLAGNILNLLIELEPDRSLKDLDCSSLPIRSAYLADATLHHVNFAGAIFDQSVFTQAFGGIVFVLYHPDGKLIATGDANGDVSLWQRSDGQRVAIYQGHTNWTRALAFSADGRMLASSSEDCTVRFWDIQTGNQIAILGPHTHTLRGMKFSKDGQRLAICGDDGLIRIYNLPQLLADASIPSVESHCIQLLRGHTNWVLSIAYSPDESQMASASADGTVRIWDLATGKCLHILAHEHWVIRTLFSPDGRQLIVSGMSSTIYVWDTMSGELIKTLSGHLDWVWSIDTSTDGNTLISAGEDRTIRVWDLQTGICNTVFNAHQDRIWSISLAPDDRQIVSGSEDRTIRIWDLQQGKCVKTISGYGNWIKSIAFVPQRDWLASCHRDGGIRLWSWQNLTCIHILSGHTDAVQTIALSPDGRYLASSSLDRTLRVWDLQELTCLQTILQRRGYLGYAQHQSANDTQVEGSCALVFSPDSCKLISGNYQADLQIWDIATGKLDRTLSGHPKRIQAVALCNVRHLIATACENRIRIWDLDPGECLHAIIAHDLPVVTVAFSPDGRYLASGSMDKTVKIWDTRSWECLQTLTGHQSLTLTVAFSPTPIESESSTDYQLIVGSGDRLIKRWNIITGECLQTYTDHQNWVWSIAYSPDGSKIVSAGEDETIKIWDVEQSRSLYTLRLKRPYEDLNITGATGLSLGQRQTLKLLGAIDG
jgi:WD40 repeat protein